LARKSTGQRPLTPAAEDERPKKRTTKGKTAQRKRDQKEPQNLLPLKNTKYKRDERGGGIAQYDLERKPKRTKRTATDAT